MFDAGLSELILLFVIGLLILGPERLPRVASQIGRWIGRARRTASQLRHQLEREIALNDIRRSPPRKAPPQEPPAGGAGDARSDASAGAEAEAEPAPAPAPEAGEASKEKSDTAS